LKILAACGGGTKKTSKIRDCSRRRRRMCKVLDKGTDCYHSFAILWT